MGRGPSSVTCQQKLGGGGSLTFYYTDLADYVYFKAVLHF